MAARTLLRPAASRGTEKPDAGPAPAAPARRGSGPPRLFGPRKRDCIVFTRGLATMQRAGIPLLASLTAIAETIQKVRLRSALEAAIDAVRRGGSLSRALEGLGGAFDRMYTAMVRVGEETGKLDQVLGRVAEKDEREEELKAQVRGALAYPTVSAVAIGGILIFLLTVVVPRFMTTFEKSGAALPLPTKIVLGASDLLLTRWPLVVGGLVLLAVGIPWILRVPTVRLVFDRAKLRLPVFGPVFLRLALARFARSLQITLASGVPILNALRLVRDVVGNAHLARVVDGLREHVETGGGMGEFLRSRAIFPPMVIQMVVAGENSGRLAEMLGEVGRYYEEQTQRAIKTMIAMLEPIMIVVMGLAVGGVLISLMLPMFTLMEALGRSA